MGDGWVQVEFDPDDPADEARAVLAAIGLDPLTANGDELAHAEALVAGIHVFRLTPPPADADPDALRAWFEARRRAWSEERLALGGPP